MNMKESILKDFIIIRRDTFRMYENGTISHTELLVFVWLNYIADKYGYAHVRSYSWFAERLPLDIKGNTVGVVMRSLRSHRFIDYSDRQGSRRGFKVKIGYWPTGNGMFRQLEDAGDEELVNSLIVDDVSESQVREDVFPKNHKLMQLKHSEKTTKSMSSVSDIITSHKNDTKKEIKKENVDISTTVNNGECINVSGFNPQLGEHAQLQHFAQLCGDECMNYWLGKYNKHGKNALDAMFRAEVKYKEAPEEKVKHGPSFFVSLIEEELISIDLGK